MAKKVFAMYLAKEGNPNSDAYAKLDLPASPWELWDAMEKVRLQTDDILYMEIEDYYAFEYLAPHLDGLEISLNELNDLAALLSELDEVQEVAFDGFLRMEVQNKVDTNGGVITLQDLRESGGQRKDQLLSCSGCRRRCCHSAGFTQKTILSPNWMVYPTSVFETAGLRRHWKNDAMQVKTWCFCGQPAMCCGMAELTTAPEPVQKTLPSKPSYLFRLALGLHPDLPKMCAR